MYVCVYVRVCVCVCTCVCACFCVCPDYAEMMTPVFLWPRSAKRHLLLTRVWLSLTHLRLGCVCLCFTVFIFLCVCVRVCGHEPAVHVRTRARTSGAKSCCRFTSPNNARHQKL